MQQKTINDDHLGQVDESWYLRKRQIKHHQVSAIWGQTLAFKWDVVLINITHGNNAIPEKKCHCFVLHHRFVTPRKSQPCAFICFLCLQPFMKHSPSFLTYYLLFSQAPARWRWLEQSKYGKFMSFYYLIAFDFFSVVSSTLTQPCLFHRFVKIHSWCMTKTLQMILNEA